MIFQSTLKQILIPICALFMMTACDTVPPEAVELSNTVGNDLEEVHRAHRSLAELHFDNIEAEINEFIDQTYRPAYIRTFAAEFKLNDRVAQILEQDPDKLLPVLSRFVEISVERIESKRAELLNPILEQRREVLSDINLAHRQIQSAQAIVTGHLASVRRVREVQNEILADVGLGDVRERITVTTAKISNKVAEFVETGNEIDVRIDDAAEKIQALDEKIDDLKSAIGR